MRNFCYCFLQPLVEYFLYVMHDKSGECRLKSCVPKHEIDAIVRTFYPAVVAFFETEEGKREFAEWKAKRENGKKTRLKSANNTAEQSA